MIGTPYIDELAKSAAAIVVNPTTTSSPPLFATSTQMTAAAAATTMTSNWTHENDSSSGFQPYHEYNMTSSEPDEASVAFSFYTEGVGLSVVSICGSVANFAAIHVMLSRPLRQTFSPQMRALALFDGLFLLFSLLTLGFPKLAEMIEWHWFLDEIYFTSPFLPIVFGCMHIGRIGSVCMTICVNIERMFAIVYPLRTAAWRKHMVPTSVAVTLAYNVPKFFELRIEEGAIVTTEMRNNALYSSLYVFWSKLVLFEVIPYVTIMLCNILIVAKVQKASRFRSRFCSNGTTGTRSGNKDEDTTGTPCEEGEGSDYKIRGGRRSRSIIRKHSEEKHIGILLLSISTIFIICQSFKVVPDLHEQLWCSSSGDSCVMRGISNVFMRLSSLLACLNSALNFFIYYVCGKRFRVAWRDTFSFCFGCRRESGSSRWRCSKDNNSAGEPGTVAALISNRTTIHTSSTRTNLTNGGSPGAAMEMIDLKSPEDILTMEY